MSEATIQSLIAASNKQETKLLLKIGKFDNLSEALNIVIKTENQILITVQIPTNTEGITGTPRGTIQDKIITGSAMASKIKTTDHILAEDIKIRITSNEMVINKTITLITDEFTR